jgi:hypothetical protein
MSQEEADSKNLAGLIEKSTAATMKASMASTKLVRVLRQTPLQPHPYYGVVVARPSNAIGGRDRDQPHLLCPPIRAAWAALRGRTIMWHRRVSRENQA